MNRVLAEMSRLVREEDGTEVVEWTLVAGLIIAVAATTFAAIGGDVSTVFGKIKAKTDQAAAAT